MAGHIATPEQRRRAVVTGIVLAVLAAAIYAVVVLRFIANT